MKNLYKLINVATDKKQAPLNCGKISHEDFNNLDIGNGSFTNNVCEELDISPGDFDGFYDGVEVIENLLASSYPGETVYFWID